MENKRLVQYGWQTSLLCIVVCLSYPVLAKSIPHPPTKKHHVRTPTNAKLKPAGSTAKATLNSSPRPVMPQPKPAQLGQNQRQGKIAISAAKDTKLAPAAALTHIKSRYLVVLKETKHHILVKTLVPRPIPQTEPRSRGQTIEGNHSLRQSHRALLTLPELPATIQTHPSRTHRAREMTERSPTLRPPPRDADLSTQTYAPTPPTTTAALLLLSTETASVNSAQEAPVAPAPPPIPAAGDTLPLLIVPPPTSTKTGMITFVEHGLTNPLMRDESLTKEWTTYAPQKAPFTVTVNEERLGYRVNSVFVLPGDELFVEISDAQKKAEYTIRSALGPEQLLASRRWYWVAPATSGLYPVQIVNSRTRSTITLNVFVMIPREQVQDGYLNGYRIGAYPTEALRQLPMYNPPRGLIEVTAENENTLVSPHFRLRQFLCKQDGAYPKYMILDARLLATLEQLLELANASGYRARTFSIMSGYRTPYYNRAIGNRTTYSRHLWGDAADIFIDEEPRDGKMDDLNQDGVIDAHDAEVIYQLIDNASEPRLQKAFMGGLARYRETSSHGPFVHVDARGSYARWGIKTLTRGGTTPAETRFQTNYQSSRPSFWDPQSPNEDLR